MRRSRTFIVFAIIIAITVGLIPASAAALSPYSNFSTRNTYSDQFTDVTSDDWFADYVRQGYELGLISGTSDNTFSPSSNLTIAQTLALAARIHSIYTTGSEPAFTTPRDGWDTWYEPYVIYSMNNDILQTTFTDFNAPARRHEVAVIFENALPESAFKVIREIAYGIIPDVDVNADYASAVYALYRAGILSGSDNLGTFNPNSYIRRSEIAAIIVRIADPNQRDDRQIPRELVAAGSGGAVLSAAEIAERVAPAVFHIETYALNGHRLGTASGFFISSDGLAIMTFRTIANTSRLAVHTADGRTHNSVKILDTSPEHNLALIRVDGTSFPYISLADFSSVRQGHTVYALSGDGTMAQDIVSNLRREINYVPHMQITTQTNQNSIGGPLLNDRGSVIGIITDTAENLNLAIPVNFAQALEAHADNPVLFDLKPYAGFSMAIDFGAFSGVMRTSPDLIGPDLTHTLRYDALDFADADHFVNTLIYYHEALIGLGFDHEELDDFRDLFTSDTETLYIHIDFEAETIHINIERFTQYYADFHTLVDFGWFFSLPLYREVLYENGSVMRYYIWTYSVPDRDETLAAYFDLLREDGFRYIRRSPTAVLFESDNLSVVIVVENNRIFLDILPLDPDAFQIDRGVG